MQFSDVVEAVILGNIIFFLTIFIIFHIISTRYESNNENACSYRLMYFEQIEDPKNGSVFHFFDKENDKFLFSARSFEEIEKNCLEIYEKNNIDYGLKIEDIKKFFDKIENIKEYA